MSVILEVEKRLPYIVSTLLVVLSLGIGLHWAFGPELRGPSVMPSMVRHLELCPSSDVKLDELEDAATQWARRGWPLLTVERGPCKGSPAKGVAYVRRCSDGDACNETAGRADTVGHDGGKVKAGTIWVRGRYERKPWHVWHEVGHVLGVGLERHDEHEGRVMSEVAGPSWKELER